MPYKPYEQAKNWRDTQTDIAKLFQKYAIGDTQWSISDAQKKGALSFVKDFKAKKKYDPTTFKNVEISPATRMVVRLTFPIGAEGKDRNQAFRVLYWYLKSKMEALSFAFQDGTELLSWQQEFFGHTMIEDASGRPATAYEAFKSGNVQLAPPSDVIALPGGKH
jgi:hypothetical protein